MVHKLNPKGLVLSKFYLPSQLIMFSMYLDRSSGRTIGVGCESQGLYYLSLTSNTCSAIDSPLTIHAQLGHPGKHTRSHFPDRVNKRASSPFALVHSDVWGPS
ncbi:hypothetical protein L195_g046031, partial [Trifolium pratense]